MGRPVKAKWYEIKEGSDLGDLQVTTSVGDEPIIRQKGSSIYDVASGRVKLVDGSIAAPEAGEATLQHDGNYVRKLTQYRAYYFDATLESGVWRNGACELVGTMLPALSAPEADVDGDGFVGMDGDIPAGGGAPVPPPASTATGTATTTEIAPGDNEVTAVVITDGGSGYAAAPAVTFTAGDGSGSPADAVGTAVLTGDVVTGVTITEGGSYQDETTVTVTFAAP